MIPNDTVITPELVEAHGLKPDEYEMCIRDSPENYVDPLQASTDGRAFFESICNAFATA